MNRLLAFFFFVFINFVALGQRQDCDVNDFCSYYLSDFDSVSFLLDKKKVWMKKGKWRIFTNGSLVNKFESCKPPSTILYLDMNRYYYAITKKHEQIRRALIMLDYVTNNRNFVSQDLDSLGYKPKIYARAFLYCDNYFLLKIEFSTKLQLIVNSKIYSPIIENSISETLCKLYESFSFKQTGIPFQADCEVATDSFFHPFKINFLPIYEPKKEFTSNSSGFVAPKNVKKVEHSELINFFFFHKK